MKVDIHTNLDLFPDSDTARSKPVFASVADMAKFIIDNEITHNVCLYPRDGYHMLEELQSLIPSSVSLYGLQVVAGNSWMNPTNINELVLDANDPKKPLCWGIKLASHRGWWYKDKSTNAKSNQSEISKYVLLHGESKPDLPALRELGIESGLDYGTQSNTVNKILKQMPENSIISMHLQGDPIMNSGSTPMMAARVAHKFPKLKFIMNHMGDFGPESQSGKNKKHIYISKQGEENLYPAFRYAHSLALVTSSVIYAQQMHNIWLDTSCYLSQKADIIQQYNCKKWCIGSDYPFVSTPKAFLKEEQKFARTMSADMINESYTATVNWLEATWEELYEAHVQLLGLEDNFDDVEYTVYE